MSLLQLNIQTVNDLLKRFDLSRFVQIIHGKRFHRLINDIAECIRKYLQFLHRFLREFQLFLMHLCGRIRDVDRMIRNSLEVADAMKQNGERPAILL